MQILVNGFVAGLLLSVLAMAFSLVYRCTRVLHLGLGGVYTVAPFVAWSLKRTGSPWYIAVALAMISGVLISGACETLNHWYLERRNAKSPAHLISSLGIYIVLIQSVALTWGNDSQVLTKGIEPVLRVGSTVITRVQLIQGCVCSALIFALSIWFSRSNLGLRLNGLENNPVEMMLRGHNVRAIRAVVFCVSGLLASVVAILAAYEFGFNARSGLFHLLLAIVAFIVGGKNSFFGPVIGALLVEIMRAEVSWILSARWQDPVTFILLALFLLARPSGLLGTTIRSEAA